MIKLILAFVGAFAIALTATATVVKMRTKPPVADSAAVKGTKHDSASPGAAKLDSAANGAVKLDARSEPKPREDGAKPGGTKPVVAAHETTPKGTQTESAARPAGPPATAARKMPEHASPLGRQPEHPPAPEPKKDSARNGAKSAPVSAPPGAKGAGATSAKPAGSEVARAAAPDAPPAGPGRISKIFSAMPAKEAAKVFEHMDDADVLTILGPVSDRKAAEVLALMPTARAASLSKALLRSRGGR